jgi:hypothetical protein
MQTPTPLLTSLLPEQSDSALRPELPLYRLVQLDKGSGPTDHLAEVLQAVVDDADEGTVGGLEQAETVLLEEI